MWYFVFIFWLALVAGIFWAYSRRRKKSDSLRAREIDALISNAKGGSPPLIAAASGKSEPVQTAASVAAPAGYSRKARLLDQRDALLYLLLRTGLPDHEVFHGLALADVIEPAGAVRGYERELETRRLAQTKLDFVVCNKRLEVAAVVMFETNGPAQDAVRTLRTALDTAGVRLVVIDPLAMPRHHQIRGLLFPEAPAPAA